MTSLEDDLSALEAGPTHVAGMLAWVEYGHSCFRGITSGMSCRRLIEQLSFGNLRSVLLGGSVVCLLPSAASTGTGHR